VGVEVTVESGHIADIQIHEYKEISSIHAGKPTEIGRRDLGTRKAGDAGDYPKKNY